MKKTAYVTSLAGCLRLACRGPIQRIVVLTGSREIDLKIHRDTLSLVTMCAAMALARDALRLTTVSVMRVCLALLAVTQKIVALLASQDQAILLETKSTPQIYVVRHRLNVSDSARCKKR